MKNIYSNIYKATNNNLKKAKIIIEKGDVVAVPTETVYGLAANAYNTKAVIKIFSLKKRPKHNPLIIHFKNIEQIKNEAVINKNFLKLAKKFSPGPLTYILKKKKNSKISKITNNSLTSIAVRIPSEKNILKLLNILKCPLAAPSANKSKSLSPTTAKHVAEEFNGKVKMIIDGGACKIGIESTVIDLTSKPKILREGGLSSIDIEKFLNIKIENAVLDAVSRWLPYLKIEQIIFDYDNKDIDVNSIYLEVNFSLASNPSLKEQISINIKN